MGHRKETVTSNMSIVKHSAKPVAFLRYFKEGTALVSTQPKEWESPEIGSLRRTRYIHDSQIPMVEGSKVISAG